MIIDRDWIGWDGNGNRVYEDHPIHCGQVLSCGECHTPICWVDGLEFNGYFQCFNCKAKDLQERK